MFPFGHATRLSRIEAKIDRLLVLATQELLKMSATDDAIAALQADVTNLTAVDQSAETLLSGLSAQLAAALAAAANAGASAAQLQSLTDLHTAITAQNTALAAAVTANTPAAAPPAAPAA